VDEWLKRIYSLRRFGREPSLTGMRALLSALGNPQEGYDKVHIAGTKGKGSVASMLHSVLMRSRSTGLYTSPHISRFTERIVVNGQEIPWDEAEELAERVLKAAEDMGYSPIFFEVATAMAFLHFRENDVSCAAVEVGLGGRYDSTNVITPVVSVITRVGYDHVERLGTTLRDIAREKAGIVKEGVPVVVGDNPPEVMETVKREALKRNAPLHIVTEECEVHRWTVNLGGTEVEFTSERTYRVRIPVPGPHQVENVLTAVRTLELMDVPRADIEAGMDSLTLRGRFEVRSVEPLVVLDGAHNPDSFRALVRTWKMLELPPPSVVFATMEDKNYINNLRVLSDIGGTLHLPPLPSHRGLDPHHLAAIAKCHFNSVFVHTSVERALATAMERPPVLVCGSFHLLGEVEDCLEM
jgi:dihydrofolate synthase/folylpolyglutamate synthase